MLKLTRYQVQDFRSVQDSGWIEADRVTALIGVNESGKTNLLLPLWKLHPAEGGKIVPLLDHPRSEYAARRQQGGSLVFIRAIFDADDALKQELADLTNLPIDDFASVLIERRFDGKHLVRFPSAKLPNSVDSSELRSILDNAKKDLEGESSDEIVRAGMLAAIGAGQRILSSAEHGHVDRAGVDEIHSKLREAPASESETAETAERWQLLLEEVGTASQRLGLIHPDSIESARQLALKNLPNFVYYSNYGNLDSEIYLPHVIQNISREEAGENLGAKEAAKARTLRVLFSFVGLQPQEILELGQSLKIKGEPTAQQIADAAERTKERSVLLQSASTKLTKEFRNWWRQGNYRFRFEADGDHFRIWVSDDLRPEEVELEARSTGLQWFLSFFLVFLVESQGAHAGAILLLDEPGLSLHPLAQRDLTSFFDGLADTNQLLYTTHSPFLVDPDRLDQVRAVHVNSAGATVASSDLRAGKAASQEFKSVYAVHSALGLSVSEAMLQGCVSVIVEGTSDQFYFSAIKTVLIALGKIRPQKELLFLPGGGAKGVTALVPVFCGKDETPPHVIFDSDSQGLQFASKLREGSIYGGIYSSLVRNIGEFLPGLQHAETEDLIPHETMANIASRMFRGEIEFEEVVLPGLPIVPQIEKYATANGIELRLGWKVELARSVKQKLVASPEKCPEEILAVWARLFEPFAGTGVERRSRK